MVIGCTDANYNQKCAYSYNSYILIYMIKIAILGAGIVSQAIAIDLAKI